MFYDSASCLIDILIILIKTKQAGHKTGWNLKNVRKKIVFNYINLCSNYNYLQKLNRSFTLKS